MKKNLSNIEKKILRKKGYPLKLVVMVGKNGLLTLFLLKLMFL